ncbi:hypothetical protein FQN54_006137 [Arachnomyces sp. PD_36]|nr:hypothetical protein FQN54_006137 [Arachnomyces sp. PD_36]
MFSVILPGRPCLTEAVPVPSEPNAPPTKFAFSFPLSPHFSHIVVFLLPGTVLPPDTAAAVYIQFPATGAVAAAPEFRFLGAIGNEKPSAIFKVSIPGASAQSQEQIDQDNMVDEGVVTNGANGLNPDAVVTLGISIEPAQNVATQLANLQSSNAASNASSTALVRQQPPRAAPSTKVLAQRIIGNAFNFLASFAASDPSSRGQEVVPLKSFQDWWAKFERRVDADPGFLERESD